MAPPRILIVPGSARSQAHSKRLAAAALGAIDRAAGAGTLIDLAHFEMPLYHGDLEARHGIPQATRRLQSLLAGHDALLIASPEYNGSMTPLLVNTLDWCSRVDPANAGASGLAVFADKPAALVGSSPGVFGGLRALIHLRDLLGYLGMVVLPQQMTVPRAHQAFDADGSLLDQTQQARLDAIALALVRAAWQFRTRPPGPAADG
ncbi:MAG TPA: NAD(P)H-dependent oxidoreductase [Burkholderiaceae bacterium]|jgi:NAD(P)H-dependent FMN reductase|nr:NAD(P)H-dependent oxidoreductase [Burkholderiaceae bacterium]